MDIIHRIIQLEKWVERLMAQETQKATWYTLPHGMFSSSATQTIASITAEQLVTFNTDELKVKVTHSTSTNPSRITLDEAGTYLITVSAVVHETTADKVHFDFWLKVDGTAIARSNTIVTCPTKEVEQTLAVSFIYPFTAGQYFEFAIWGATTTIELLATAAGSTPTRPACPSIICAVNKISN
jgi:hypothetical protein